MARAHLAVDVELANSFLAAQSEPAVRWIAATVKGEAVCLLKTGSGAADAAAAFGELATGVPLAKDEPCFVVLAREAPGAATRKWQLVCWVPDAAAPRLKMLYSSSREDLKTSLGAGFFASAKDYCANDAADLDWAHVAAAEAGGGAPLTAAELFRKEEAAAEAATDRRASVGMAAVPFHLTPDARAALEAVASGAASLVEVVVGAGETLELAQPPSTDASSVKDSLSALDAPRFVVVRAVNDPSAVRTRISPKFRRHVQERAHYSFRAHTSSSVSSSSRLSKAVDRRPLRAFVSPSEESAPRLRCDPPPRNAVHPAPRRARVDDLDFDIRFVEHGLQVRGIVAVDALDLARAVVAEREAVAGRDDDVLFVFALVLVPALLGRAASAASVALARLAVRHPVDVRLARGGLGIGGVEAVVDVIPATLVAALAVLRALALDRLALARSESLVTLINVRQRGTSAFVYFC